MPIIYQPKGRAGEYSPLAVNLALTCSHGCAYCYAPGIVKKPREQFHDFAGPRKDVLMLLRKEAPKFQGRDVFLCFTTDPCQPGLVQTTAEAIRILNDNDIGATVLTKSHHVFQLEEVMTRHERNRMCMTLTMANPHDSKRWEPHAANPDMRVTMLGLFHAKGVLTGASLEPIIQPMQTAEIMERASEYVNHFMLGKMNYVGRLPGRLRAEADGTNWPGTRTYLTTFLQNLGFTEWREPGTWGPGHQNPTARTYTVKQDLREAE